MVTITITSATLNLTGYHAD